MNEIFTRNIGAITKEEQDLLATKCAVIAGCGGLGSYLCEYSVRLGIGKLIVVDSDKYELSNFNRQLLATQSNLHEYKAQTEAKRFKEINPDVEVEYYNTYLNEENVDKIIEKADIVLDGLDNYSSRIMLEKACAKANLYMINGAIGKTMIQVCTIPPKAGILEKMFTGQDENSINRSCLSFVPAYCAAIQVSEALKILTGKKAILENKILYENLETLDRQIISF